MNHDRMGIKILKASKEMGITSCKHCGKTVRYFVHTSDDWTSCQSCFGNAYRKLLGFSVKTFNFEEMVLAQDGMRELAQYVQDNNIMYYNNIDQFLYLLECMDGKVLNGVSFRRLAPQYVEIRFTKTRQYVQRVTYKQQERLYMLWALFLYSLRNEVK